MTKIILNQDQHYICPIGQIKCGKKGDCVDVDDSFLQHIEGKYDLPEDVEEGEGDAPSKPLKSMNKAELIEVVKSKEIEMSDEDLKASTKAQLVAIIEEN